jgi:hypothetical protein
MQRDQNAWIATSPGMEGHLGTAPKQQVLDEIGDARSAAQRMGDSEMRYQEARIRQVSGQIATLKQAAKADTSEEFNKMMSAAVADMLHNLAEDRDSLQDRYDELNKSGIQLRPDQVAVRDWLKTELTQTNDAYLKLERKAREIEKNPHQSRSELESAQAGLLVELSTVMSDAESQKSMVDQERTHFDRYYTYLAAAVAQRPDEAQANGKKGQKAVKTAPAVQAKVAQDTPPAKQVSAKKDNLPPPPPPGESRAQPDVFMLAGTWIVPQASKPEGSECPLARAKLNIDDHTAGKMTGDLTLEFDPTLSNQSLPSACPTYVDGQEFQIVLHLTSGHFDPDSVIRASFLYSGQWTSPSETKKKDNSTRVYKFKGILTVDRLPQPNISVTLDQQSVETFPALQGKQFIHQAQYTVVQAP